MSRESLNSPKQDHSQAEKAFEDKLNGGDAVPVCPNCLRPCSPLQNYCEHCGSNAAINPLATYMPFVNIRFTYGAFGTMWRKVWYDRETAAVVKFVYMMLIILFAPIILIFGAPLFLTGKIKRPRTRKAVQIVLYVVLGLLLAGYVVWHLSTFSSAMVSEGVVCLHYSGC